MAAKKKTEDLTRRYRVARAFRHEGRMITRAAQLEDLSAEALKDRTARGYLEDRAPVSDTAPAAKAKE